ncbi:unnamed protein product [Trichobilharzia regenti]|nr:unnamed protein product [Trichobilharzia regenti]
MKSWIRCAATAGAYVYKSVRESVSQPLRVWLSNAASAVILHGLLGELSVSTQEDTDGNATNENISLPDTVVDDRLDGYWYYGSWTVENVASSSEMRGVLKAEMANACVSVMIASVVNYFEENRYTPSGFRKGSYACWILRSRVMQKYGLTDESDKTMAMLITGNKLFGRLITYLKIFEPRSELLLYPQLRKNGETREKHYFDYSPRWEDILKLIFDEIYMPSGRYLPNALESDLDVHIKLPVYDKNLLLCWSEYDVDDDIRQWICLYFRTE